MSVSEPLTKTENSQRYVVYEEETNFNTASFVIFPSLDFRSFISRSTRFQSTEVSEKQSLMWIMRNRHN